MKVLQFPSDKALPTNASGSTAPDTSPVNSPSVTSTTEFFLREIEICRDEIKELKTGAGEDNPWTSAVYERLGKSLFQLALEENGADNLLKEAEETFQEALRLSSTHGDLAASARHLVELAAIAELKGDVRLSEERYERSEELHELLHTLKSIPANERLQYDHPAISKSLSTQEKQEFQANLAEMIADKGPTLSDLERKRIEKVLFSSVSGAVQEERWIDDQLALEMAQEVQMCFSSPQEHGQALGSRLSYKGIYEAASFFQLGLKEKTLRQLAKL
jgi:tetratricopeptide (TPR) repeat protein